MSRSEDWTPLQQAAYDLVHDYHGPDGRRGAEALAPRVGKTPRTLDNEVNPDVTTHKLGLEDAASLSLAADDARILKAFAGVMHHAVVPLPDYSRVSDVELLTKYAEWQAFIGRTCQRIHEALDAHRIQPREYEAIRMHGMDHMQRFFEFLSRLESLVEEEKT